MRRCKADFFEFAKHLKVLNKGLDPDDPLLHGLSAADKIRLTLPKLEPFKLRYSQEVIARDMIEHYLLGVLKPRQTYASTIVAAVYLWIFCTNENFKLACVAHQRGPARELLEEKYLSFYNTLPWWLKPARVAGSKDELKCEGGRVIKVGTMYGSGKDAFRAYMYAAAHLSEAAMYQDFDGAMAALSPTLIPGARIVYETTAKGMNQFYHWWGDRNGYKKTFLAWMDNKEYVLRKSPREWSFGFDPTLAADKDGFSKKELAYFQQLKNAGIKLSKPQKNWMAWTLRSRCSNHLGTFNQEYPWNEQVAFVASGDPYFDISYKGEEWDTGLIIYKEPEKFRIYAMGVDPASGSKTGDYSSFTIYDVTEKKQNRIFTVATFYDRIGLTRFAGKCIDFAKRYNNALVAIEKNNHGASVLDRFIVAGYARLYLRIRDHADPNRDWSEEAGWVTDKRSKIVMYQRLNEYASRGWLDPDVGQPRDARLRMEMNTVVHGEGNQSPGARPGFHDDQVDSSAIGLMCLDQCHKMESELMQHKPSTWDDICAWQMATGKSFKDHEHEFHDPLYDRQDFGDALAPLQGMGGKP